MSLIASPGCGARSSSIAKPTDSRTGVPGPPDPSPPPDHGGWGRWGPGRSWYDSWGPPTWGLHGGPDHGGPGRRLSHRHWRGPFRRSRDTRVVAGVCGGISGATGIDVTLVRIGFVLLTLGSGAGVLIYALAWLFVPLEGETSTIFSRAVGDRRGIRLIASIIPVLVVIQIVSATLHLGYVGSFSWPIFLAAGVVVLIRRNASQDERVWINDDLLPMFRTGDDHHTRISLVVRIALGIAVGVGGLFLLLDGHPTSATLVPVSGALLVLASIVVIFGPWWISLVRDLMAERQARALAEERAQMAAHVHDSVLQTLALIQRSADDPRHVVRLARAQERELRSWLFEGRPPGSVAAEATTVDEGIGLLQRLVEADHGITVQVVVVGDCPLNDRLRALVDAAREATVNAAKWSGAPEVSIYCEVEQQAVTVFVRDRGRGFDPSDVPGDRQGIAQSIRARMARFGGSATIRSAPGQGTEVELSVPRRELTA
jgi:signal transduction histidine kinase